MKNRLISFVVVAYMLLQSSGVHGAQGPKQSWTDWAWSLMPGRPEETKARVKEILPVSAAGAVAGYAAAKTFPKLTERMGSAVFDVMIENVSSSQLGTAILVLDFMVYAQIIREMISYYRTGRPSRADAVQAIKDYLRIAIGNLLFYPTRSSKINVLIKKDEFLEYIDDQDDLLQDACSQLISEIDIPDYPNEQEDRKIDGYISKLKVNIAHLPLEQQIAELEKIIGTQKTIEEMRGYLSLYYRLKNKLEVEKRLTPEQVAKKVSLPQMSPEQLKSFERSKQAQQAEKMKREELERLGKEKEVEFVAPSVAPTIE